MQYLFNHPIQPYWEEFQVEYDNKATIIECLQEIARYPQNARGEKVAPIAWDSNCHEGACGTCSMVVNGKPVRACLTLVKDLKKPITLSPMKSFPILRDLCVDKASLFKGYGHVLDAIPVSSDYAFQVENQKSTPPLKENICINCGICMEVCPQVNAKSPFMGAAALHRADLMNQKINSEQLKDRRLQSISGPEGIESCDQVQACYHHCPQGIDLISSLGRLSRKVLKKGVRDWLGH